MCVEKGRWGWPRRGVRYAIGRRHRGRQPGLPGGGQQWQLRSGDSAGGRAARGPALAPGEEKPASTIGFRLYSRFQGREEEKRRAKGGRQEAGGAKDRRGRLRAMTGALLGEQVFSGGGWSRMAVGVSGTGRRGKHGAYRHLWRATQESVPGA